MNTYNIGIDEVGGAGISCRNIEGHTMQSAIQSVVIGRMIPFGNYMYRDEIKRVGNAVLTGNSRNGRKQWEVGVYNHKGEATTVYGDIQEAAG